VYDVPIAIEVAGVAILGGQSTSDVLTSGVCRNKPDRLRASASHLARSIFTGGASSAVVAGLSVVKSGGSPALLLFCKADRFFERSSKAFL